MARHATYWTYNHSNSDPINFGASPGTFGPFVAELRDFFRAGDGRGYANLNQGLPSPRYVVSDIAKWPGLVTAVDGHGFIVRDTTLGCEWAFIFSSNTNGNLDGRLERAIGGYDNFYPFIQSVTSAADNTGGNNIQAVAVWFAPDYATDSFAEHFGFDDTSALTYSLGDYQAPSVNPSNDAGATTWFGTTKPRGLAFPTPLNTWTDFVFMFDEDVAALGVYSTTGADGDVNALGVLGDIINPSDGADTHTAGALWTEISTGTGQPPHADGYVDGFDSAGARVFNMTLEPTKLFTADNDQALDGKYKWKPCEVNHAAVSKGWIKDTLVREIGGTNDNRLLRMIFAAPSATLPMVKYTNALAFFYLQGLQPAPFAYGGRAEIGNL